MVVAYHTICCVGSTRRQEGVVDDFEKASEMLTSVLTALGERNYDQAAIRLEQVKSIAPSLFNRELVTPPRTIKQLVKLLRYKNEAGAVLLKLRHSFGLTQEAMGAICGVAGVTVGYWENGRQAMRQENMERLLAWIEGQGVTEIEPAPEPAALTRIRETLGFSTLKMAGKLKVKESEVRRMELGRLIPTAATIARYRELGASVGVAL